MKFQWYNVEVYPSQPDVIRSLVGKTNDSLIGWRYTVFKPGTLLLFKAVATIVRGEFLSECKLAWKEEGDWDCPAADFSPVFPLSAPGRAADRGN